MDNSAMKRETPIPHLDQILTGHERRDSDHCWRPHGTADWLLIHTLAGTVSVGTESGERLIRPGETILYSPGAVHDFGNDRLPGDWEVVWAHFLPPVDWLRLLQWTPLGRGVMHMPEAQPEIRERIETCLLEADRLYRSGLPSGQELALNSLEAALLWWNVQNPTHAVVEPRILAAIDYLSRNPSRRVPVGELAAVAHLSASRFAHLFRAQMGTSPGRFVERQRIDQAKHLLELTLNPIGTIARETGFVDQFHFSRRFKALTGLSPTNYRREKWAGTIQPRAPQ